MFLSDIDLRKRLDARKLIIEPFDSFGLGSVTYSLRLGEGVYVRTNRSQNRTIELPLTGAEPSALTWVPSSLHNGSYDVKPGSAVLVTLIESITLPLDLFGLILPLSTRMLEGLDLTPSLIEPGWSGRLVILLRNVGSSALRLRSGLFVAQMAFAELTTPTIFGTLECVIGKNSGEPAPDGEPQGPLSLRVPQRPAGGSGSPDQKSPLGKHADLTRDISKRIVRRVILMTDQAGSTLLMEKHLVAGASAVILQRNIVLDAISINGGRGEPTGGDGTVSAFENIADALEAACTARQELARHNHSLPSSDQVQARFAIHCGQVIEEEKVGLGYNVAARILASGEANQILVSEDARSEAEALRVRFRFEFFQLLNAKGINQPIPVFLLNDES